MKRLVLLFIITVLCANCAHNRSSRQIESDLDTLKKAVVFYEPNWCWGDFLMGRADTPYFLSTGNNTVTITDRDSLYIIESLIDLTNADTLSQDSEYGWGEHCRVFPLFAVLLHYKEHIDTLALSESSLDIPNGYRYQYNNLLKDSVDTRLFDYISNIVRDRDSVWRKNNEDFYYDGRYHNKNKDGLYF